MRLPSGEWLVLDEVTSTQTVAAEALRSGEDVAVVMAAHQTAGRGRFERQWFSPRGGSLAASLIFREYAGHAKPWLIGMALAVAAAGALHCRVQWPNDLVLSGKKVGGILTEMIDGVPVVGIGVNLARSEGDGVAGTLPDHLAERAGTVDPRATAEDVLSWILARFERLPEMTEWGDLAEVWRLFDDTPGKRYVLPTGEEAVALGVGPDGELLCSVEGESVTVTAADAIFGA